MHNAIDVTTQRNVRNTGGKEERGEKERNGREEGMETEEEVVTKVFHVIRGTRVTRHCRGGGGVVVGGGGGRVFDVVVVDIVVVDIVVVDIVVVGLRGYIVWDSRVSMKRRHGALKRES